MRFRLVVVLLSCVFLSSTVLAAEPNPHIRILDHALAKTVSDGIARSPTFARIVDGLDRSNVVVYIGFSKVLPPSLGGRTTFMTATGKWRYLRIVICTHLSEVQRIAMVAHELHHALEIGSSPEVRDLHSLADLYKAIGVPAACQTQCYETASAIDAADDVDRELRRWPGVRTATPPAVAHPSHSRGAFVATKE